MNVAIGSVDPGPGLKRWYRMYLCVRRQYSCCCKPQMVSTLTAKGKSLPRCNGRVAVVPADAAPIRLPRTIILS